MFRVALIASLLLVCASALEVNFDAQTDGDRPVHDEAFLSQLLGHDNMTWAPGFNSKFDNATLKDVGRLLGTFMKGDANYVGLPEKEGSNFENIALDIPAEFDARTAFPKCAAVIGHVRDQSSCGSCWAFGSTEAFNDRRCIKTGDTTLLSPEDTTACCTFSELCFSMGCNGGNPSAAWSWFKRTGVVSGGDFGDTSTCLPYSLKQCAHHVTSTKYDPCPTTEYKTPKCTKACANTLTTGKTYKTDKNKASQAYGLTGVAKIQSDLMTYGSVTGAFSVYADFPNYKTGVYKHVTGAMLGGHAIKILGWGTEAGTDYWLVANSWNEEWGDKGFFKIARGTNECGIEGQISAGQA